MNITLVVAVDEDGGFGRNGKIPWNYPEDFKHFSNVTRGTKSTCIMGRLTYEDMLTTVKARKTTNKQIKRILPKRDAIVVSSNTTYIAEGAIVQNSLANALHAAGNTAYIIGGESLFNEAIKIASTVYMTVVPGKHDCDRFFPVGYIADNFTITSGRKVDNLMFLEYNRI